ncbi:MAG: thiamine pyrophosphate-dependent enzyme [Chloroflexota bacterium]
MSYRRYELLKDIAPIMVGNALIIANIGFPSQELYNIQDSPQNFYMLGSMGLSSSIGLGLAQSLASKNDPQTVIAIDGDGSVLMNLGTLATIGNYGPSNFILLLVDNGAYGSTGDQPTHTAGKTDLAGMARAAGIESVHVTQDDEAKIALEQCMKTLGPHVIVAKVAPGSPQLKPIPMDPGYIRDRFRQVVSG